MTVVRRLLLVGPSALAFVASLYVLLVLTPLLDGLRVPTQIALPLFLAAVTIVPTAAAWSVARVLARRWGAPVQPAQSWLPALPGRALVVAYALTAILGVPAAQSQREAWAVSEYKRVKASGSHHVSDSHPCIRTYASLPVLPFVIVSYHAYVLTGLYGSDGFEVAVWYGTGVLPVVDLATWVS